MPIAWPALRVIKFGSSGKIPRVQRPVGRKIKDGLPVIVAASVEDLSSPEIILHRIIRAEDFLAANAVTGFNERQICRAIIVFLFAHWDEEFRPKIAAVRGVAAETIKVNEFGDLRILRHNIVHLA